MSDNVIELTINQPGQRLDRALSEARPDLSRAQWQRLIKEGAVTVDGQAAKVSYKLSGTESITVTLPPPTETELVAENIPLDILYEDDDLLAVNKPAGMVVHPAAGHAQGTLVNAVLYHCPDVLSIGGERRPGIIHRLDKDTSGIILVAKNDAALNFMQDQFKERTIKKEYLALVHGHVEPEKALIDAPIGRDPRQRKRMAIIRPGSSATSRPSQTRYEVEIVYDDYSLVRCFPLTGRTHQIRVHLAYIGYPIVADAVYGRRKETIRLKRHFLHAAQLSFIRPSDGDAITLTAPLSAELQRVLNDLS